MLAISPGHWHIGTGANDWIDEVEEARKVVHRVTQILRERQIVVHIIVDDVSSNQTQNLRYLVNAHNAVKRELDVSIHFNAATKRQYRAIGTEVLYVNSALQKVANSLSEMIAYAGRFKNRGAKRRKDIYFLNFTAKPALLVEICFVNSEQDCIQYKKTFRRFVKQWLIGWNRI